MKYTIAAILAFVVTFSLAYLFVCFIKWEVTDLGTWQPFDRFMFLTFGGVFSVFFTAIVFDVINHWRR